MSPRKVPDGTVAVRKCRNRQGQARYVKDGNGDKGWTLYARWWWENNVGPVPPGKRVIHRDGDCLNDDPLNLVLGTAGDVAYLWSQRAGPAELARMRRRLKAACVRRNREHAALDRLMGVIQKTLYYVVDHGRRTVSGPHGSRLWHAAKVLDPSVTCGTAGRGMRLAAQACGVTADVRGMEVAILLALGAGPLATPELLAGSRRLAGLLHVPAPGGRVQLAACVYGLRRRGLLAPSDRRGTRSNVHGLSGAGAAAVAPAMPRACVKGVAAQRYVEAEGYEYAPVLPEGC